MALHERGAWLALADGAGMLMFRVSAGRSVFGRGSCLWLMDMPGLAYQSSADIAESARCEARGIGQAMTGQSHMPNRFKWLFGIS